MNRRSEAAPVRRLPLLAVAWGVVTAALIAVFTRNILYSIIALAATAMAVAGFLLMVLSVNRILSRGRGTAAHVWLALARLALIAAAFYAVSRISEGAVLAFLAGVSALPLALLSEGAYQLLRSYRHGT